jgi:hypothetical protein
MNSSSNMYKQTSGGSAGGYNQNQNTGKLIVKIGRSYLDKGYWGENLIYGGYRW